MGEDRKDLEATVARLRKDISKYEEAKRASEDGSLQFRWRIAVRTFGETKGHLLGKTDYPRMDRLFEIVREDGRIRLMMGYDTENPDPDFSNNGQRRHVEALLKFEEPLVQMIEEAGNRWRAGDFEGEATLLEEYAISNPQREAILALAEEARRDEVSGATSKRKPKRR